MSEELRPCPFCGNEAIVNNNFSEPFVRCAFGGCVSNLISAWQWNQRPIEDALRAKLEIAKEALKYYTNIDYLTMSAIAKEALQKLEER